MGETPMSRKETFAALPPEWPEPVLDEIRERVAASGRRVVVLDDDPTGTQTVHDIAVLTEWSPETLAPEMRADAPGFYLLTNSRSLPLAAACRLNAEIGLGLVSVSRATGCEFEVVSRSDSTLRGHFPGEVRALADALDVKRPRWLIAPFFEEGGRFTIDDVHYVADGDRLTPAGATPYAQDAAFGYRASNLREWVEEKTAGDIAAEDVVSVSLDAIRRGGPERVAKILNGVPEGGACVVNAASYRDMEVVVLGLIEAESRGARFVCRTAASFVRCRLGLGPRPLLTADELNCTGEGGALIVVGSYVPRTTEQLAHLRQNASMRAVELNVNRLLMEEAREEEITRATAMTDEALADGENVVLFTSRDLVVRSDGAGSLSVGQAVSSGVTAVVGGITVRPRLIVAKGGITSSDVATEALGVKRAMVLGQILPGVPVWRLGEESRFPGLAYVVFPGNVGEADALTATLRRAGT